MRKPKSKGIYRIGDYTLIMATVKYPKAKKGLKGKLIRHILKHDGVKWNRVQFVYKPKTKVWFNIYNRFFPGHVITFLEWM